MSPHVVNNVEENVDGNGAIELKGNFNETIQGTQGVSVAKDGAWSVGGNGGITFSGTGSFSVGKKLTQDVGADFAVSVADNATASVGKSLLAAVQSFLSRSARKSCSSLFMSALVSWTAALSLCA
jgi:hypothetical protein